MCQIILARLSVTLLAAVAFNANTTDNLPAWPGDYYKAVYLAEAGHDPAGAVALLGGLESDASLNDTQRDTVRQKLADAQELVVAEDLARLCPPDTIAYVEIREPGALVERLTTMLGIETKPIQPMLAARKPRAINWNNPAPTDFIPDEIAMSPALARWLKAFDGIAVAFTGLDPQPAAGGLHGTSEEEGDRHHEPIPTGIAILNPGDADLMRGLIEMAAQFAPSAEPIDGNPAFEFPYGITAAMTERLVIVGRPRAQVEAAVARVKSKDNDNLAASEQYKSLTARKAGSTLLAYVDAQRVLALAKPHLRGEDEFQTARAVLDLDNLVGGALAFGAIDNGIGLDVSIMMKEDHHNLVYNLIRTPAMSRRSLSLVPGKAAFVFGFGLNPANGHAAESAESKGKKLEAVTGLDVFRELFGNIEEIAAYVAPPEGNGLFGGKSEAPPFVPNGAVIIAAGNAERSEALWTQILSLPSKIMPDKAGQPQEIEINGQKATAFPLPEVGNIYIARTNNCLIISPRKESLASVLKTAANGKSVLQDEAFAGVVSTMKPDIGLMVLAHAGRIIQVAAPIASGMSPGDAPPEPVMNMMTNSLAPAMSKTVAFFGLSESDTELNLRISLAGLPNVNQLLKQIGPMARVIGQMRHTQQAQRVSVVEQPVEPGITR